MNEQEFGLEKRHFTDKELLEDTLNQIEKDFGQIELQLREVKQGDDYFERLCADLSYTVDALLDKAPDRLFSLMYRIDLPESRISNLLGSDEPAMAIAEMILKRELQKVVIRRKFSA